MLRATKDGDDEGSVCGVSPLRAVTEPDVAVTAPDSNRRRAARRSTTTSPRAIVFSAS